MWGFLTGYDRYSFGIGQYIGIDRYIGLTDKENALSVLVSLSANQFSISVALPIQHDLILHSANITLVPKILTLLSARNLNRLGD